MVLIGLECHEQLKSDAKLFCRCPANYRGAEPNANVCPVCTSQPGAKPMAANKTALENAVELALALGCSVAAKPIHVQRKHYFYPDLPSGYQRTSKPIATGGSLAGVRIREMHIEEDPGRYDLHGGATDFNRSGVPLVEIVTDRKSTRLNSSHNSESRMPSSA
jgi:aspartyl-tRNA(Asn)/glutamyl-tRNA(Gln) amidotransferase subunit B